MLLEAGYQPKCPLDILPDEIISEIMKETWRMLIHAHPISGPFLFPHSMMLVCKRWRDVTLATPLLWSFLVFSSASEEVIPCISLHLERSKACPIFLEFTYNFVFDGDTDAETVLDVLQSHKKRIRVLRANMPSILQSYFLSKTIGYDEGPPATSGQPVFSDPSFVSAVQRLMLCMPLSQDDNPLEHQKPVYVPNLESLECCMAYLPNFIFCVPPAPLGPHGRLKRLVILEPTPGPDLLGRFISVLSQNPGLQMMWFANLDFPPETSLGQPIKFEDLEFIRLSHIRGRPHSIPILLSLLDAPNLKDAVFGKMRISEESRPVPTVFRKLQRVAFSEEILSGLSFCPPSVTHIALERCSLNAMAGFSSYMRSDDRSAPEGSAPIAGRLPYLHTVSSKCNSLPSLIDVLRNQTSTIKTVQIFSKDLMWETARLWTSWRRGGRRGTMQEHWENIEWIKQNFSLMVWGPRFLDELNSSESESESESETDRSSRSWVSVVCDGLPWLDEGEVWTGKYPE